MRGINGACMEEYAKLQIEKLPSWQSNYVRAGDPSSNSYPVTGVTFDAICEDRKIDRIYFLKLNIQGSQWEAGRYPFGAIDIHLEEVDSVDLSILAIDVNCYSRA